MNPTRSIYIHPLIVTIIIVHARKCFKLYNWTYEKKTWFSRFKNGGEVIYNSCRAKLKFMDWKSETCWFNCINSICIEKRCNNIIFLNWRCHQLSVSLLLVTWFSITGCISLAASWNIDPTFHTYVMWFSLLLIVIYLFDTSYDFWNPLQSYYISNQIKNK